MSHSKQWRQPAPEQLGCEQRLAAYLKQLVLSGKRVGNKLDYSSVDRVAASQAIERHILRAQTLGKAYAGWQLKHLGIERGVKGAILGGLKAIGDMASDLIDRVLSWASDLFAERVDGMEEDEADITDADLEQVLEDVSEQVSETLAITDIQTVIEQTVMSELQSAEVAKVEVVNEPGACELCTANAEAGPVPIGTPFPSGQTEAPFHLRCRCHVQAVR